jgi:hypothetical protein
MTLRKPFKAVPIRPAARSRDAARPGQGNGARSWLLGAALIGCAVGTGTVAATPEGRTMLMTKAKPVAVVFGLMRERAPEEGDHWHGCNDARAAGTAPIYRGEPGYRPEMDGDNDGIACEPIP